MSKDPGNEDRVSRETVSCKKRVELFPAEEIGPGQIRRIELNGVGIAIVRAPSGEFHALRDVCPHAGARLSLGKVEHVVEAEAVGDYRLTQDFAVRCPWHGYEFAVETGRCLADPRRTRVRSYDLEVIEGHLVLWA